MSSHPAVSAAGIHGLIDDVTRSALRLFDSVAALTDGELRSPSGLEGWTRGHVLAHVSRSADAYVWLLRLARTGAEPGPRPDAAALARAVEETAGLSAARLVTEVRRSLEQFLDQARAMPVPAWDGLVTALAGWRHPAWYTLHRCLREVETHHLDLGLGHGTADWPASYVLWALDDTLATLSGRGFALASVEAVDLGRSWNISADGPVVSAPGHVLLGWLSGRTRADESTSPFPGVSVPCPPPWPQPPTPGWGRCGGGGGG
ncbi:maleylpyruvate isomerase family mycothiol-dependent enzyme [Streptomyces hygroscopicus]|uniref:maleylpyruvate isomerase family mycothiol-dependent enzyme n=1 Tax=Streptomyces hygroscopicus TaxID=1912 RepID=UPI00223FA0BE|nr:maleylpyruvate isomerase family mycothiol-dependent enzyme [Streptomyces hygroscopicus]